VVLLLAPVFFRLGFAWTVLTWILLMGLYYARRERAGAAIVLVALAAVALLLPVPLAHLSYPGSRQEARYRAARDVGAIDAAERLAGLPDPLPDELYVLGMRATWTGEVDRAIDLLTRAERAGHTSAALYVTLGNLKYGRGDKNAAIAYYERATRAAPDEPVAYFNLSRVYHSMAESKKGGEAHRQAFAVDESGVEALEREAKRNGPDWVAPQQMPAAVIWSTPPGTAEVERSARQIWRWIGGKTLARVYFAIIALGGVVLVVFMAWARGVFKPSSSCGRCGAAACRRCNSELSDQTICGQCYHAFVLKEGVDPQARVKKEIEVHRYQARALRVRRILSLLLVGTGQMLTGRPLVGLAFLITFASSTLGALVAAGVLPTPSFELGSPSTLSLVLTIPLALAAYCLGLWEQARSERR
jgi:tetratricopeptide (TPR) repeat protein